MPRQKKQTLHSICKEIEKQIPKNKKYLVLIKVNSRGWTECSKNIPRIYSLKEGLVITKEDIDSVVAEINKGR